MTLHSLKHIKRCLLLALFCLGVSGTMPATNVPKPSRTIDGIRYFEYTRVITPWWLGPTLPDLRLYGFTVNKDDEETYIAPDGKIVPKFCDGLWVVSPNDPNGELFPIPNVPSSYSGNIYLPDMIEDFHDGFQEKDEFVMGFDPSAMAEGLISIRTPLYARILYGSFINAINLQKVQIGACYVVEPMAFRDCAKLKTVIFEKAPYVHKEAFIDCVGIRTVVLLSELPLLASTSAFEECVYENATLYISDDLMNECKQDPVWGRFARIKSLKEYDF